MEGIKCDFEAVKVEIDVDEELLQQWSDEETAEPMTISSHEDYIAANDHVFNNSDIKICTSSNTTTYHQPRILLQLKCSKCFTRFSDRNKLSEHLANCTVSPEASLLSSSPSSSLSSGNNKQQIITVSGDHGNMKFDISQDVGQNVKIFVQTIGIPKKVIETRKKQPPELLPCPVCPGLFFPSDRRLNLHVKDCHIPGCYVCECGEKFIYFGKFRFHKKKFHNEEIDEEIVKSHEEMKKKEYAEGQKKRMREKKKKAPPKKRKSRCSFFCDFPGCNFGFEKAEVFEKHRKSHANETTVYNCPVCSRPCPTKNALSIHLARLHPDSSARYPCRTKYRVFLPNGQKAMKRCKASFASKAELTIHKRIHREDKKKAEKKEKEQKKVAAINSNSNSNDGSDNMEETSTTKEDTQKELKGNNNNASTASTSNNLNDNNNANNNSSTTSIPVPTPVKKKPYPCLANNCPRSFATSRTRANHMEINHGIKY